MRIGDFEVTRREGGHAHDLPFLPIPIDPKRVAAETPVRDLNFDLKRLQAAHDDGSHGTRTARSYALAVELSNRRCHQRAKSRELMPLPRSTTSTPQNLHGPNERLLMMRAEGSGERTRRPETGRLPTADGVRQPEDSTAWPNSY